MGLRGRAVYTSVIWGNINARKMPGGFTVMVPANNEIEGGFVFGEMP